MQSGEGVMERPRRILENSFAIRTALEEQKGADERKYAGKSRGTEGEQEKGVVMSFMGSAEEKMVQEVRVSERGKQHGNPAEDVKRSHGVGLRMTLYTKLKP